MTLTQLAAAIDAYLLLNPLQLNATAILETPNGYYHVGTDPTFEFISSSNVVVVHKGDFWGS